ncbi:hypothetical protein HYR54_07520 [Candidatus Acetothermia bacterium]|nr:hypothetical protein [Candidatus Acetothermia bacterium]
MGNLKSQPFAPPAKPSYKEVRDASAGKPLEHPALLTQPSLTRPLAPNLFNNGESIDDQAQPDGFFHHPADPVIAVGPNHIVVVVNSTLVVYDKSKFELQRTSLANWFANVCNGCQPFDPRIAYDLQEGHWLMLVIARNENANPQESWYLLSVSQTTDPTGAWWNYKLPGRFVYNGVDPNGEVTWADFPDLGYDGINSVSGGAVYISSNQFTFAKLCGVPIIAPTECFRTTLVNILPKSQLYKGGMGFGYWEVYDTTDADGAQAFALRATHTFGNPGGEFLINSKSGGGDKVTVHKLNPTYPPTPVDMTRQATVSIGSYSPPPSASQPNCIDTLDTGDNRMYNAIYRNGQLYAAFTQSQDWGHGNVAAIRYLKVNTSTNSTEINTLYGADGFNYFYPAIHTDNSDNIVLVFGRSSPSEFASVRYTGQKTSDDATQSSEQLAGGDTCIQSDPPGKPSRWGDYFGIAQDPADGSRIWVYGQWAKDISNVQSPLDWGTWFGETSFSNVPPPATRIKFRGTVQSVGGDQTVPIYNTLVQTVLEGPADLVGSTLPVTDFGAVVSCSDGGPEVSPNIQAGTKVEVFGKLDGTAVSVECSPDYIKSILKLTVTKAGAGSGAVSGTGIDCGSDCEEEYFYNTSVSLSAVASPGSVFTGWSGACSGTGNCMLTMDADKAVTGNFSPPDGPDLTGFFSGLTVTCKGGRRPSYQIKAKLVIQNIGNVEITRNQAFDVDFFFDDLNRYLVFLASQTVKQRIKPGKSTTLSKTLKFNSCPRGANFIAILDMGNAINERNENNNSIEAMSIGAAFGLGQPAPLLLAQVRAEPAADASFVRFNAEGIGIATIRVQAFDLTGRAILDAEANGSELLWRLDGKYGTAIADGVYLYVVWVRGYDGRTSMSEIRKLVLFR